MAGEPSMTLDAILKVIEIVSFLGGGGLVFFRLGRVTASVQSAMATQTADISELKQDIKVVSRVLTELAVQKTRLDNIDKRIDELRHGDGWIRGARGIDKQYP